MGIIKRFGDIMSANINALLDKAEDPAKMIDQYLRDLNNELGNVKAETASVMATEAKAKRELDESEAEIARLLSYAEKAVAAGNDDDAKVFLQQKAKETEKAAALKQAYELAHANAEKIRAMHDKLVEDIAQLNARRDAIKAKVSVAKTQQKLNDMASGIQAANDSKAAFERMEEKADRMLDEASAMAELNQSGEQNQVDDLKEKYSGSGANVEDELAALKAKLNK